MDFLGKVKGITKFFLPIPWHFVMGKKPFSFVGRATKIIADVCKSFFSCFGTRLTIASDFAEARICFGICHFFELVEKIPRNNSLFAKVISTLLARDTFDLEDVASFVFVVNAKACVYYLVGDFVEFDVD